MQRGLVVVDKTDAHRGLIREAAEHAVGADAELVLFTTMTREEFESNAETLETIGSVENVSYDSDTALDAAANDVREFAADLLPAGVDVDVVARATDDDERADAVLDLASERDCDHVFVLGRRRSPTGKALFGDIAQRIALNFDGYVTLATS
ncbi:universal stress protein [Halorarum halophilum]|uniref:Universal stress protein n=1 Tax=Halorarum halophilum TaxID=2743090 RepID=A0A7D5K2Q2_9EURY|nr:universal stress protein [Halobaculum halophilum]QLG29021.1 universal stress protein [Halobaculum halophilum]